LVNGKSTSEIAQILNVNINTVRYHLKSCYVKAQVNNQAELVGLVLRVMVNFTSS
jgi:DNA-binding CsgD family transcriptional regulator